MVKLASYNWVVQQIQAASDMVALAAQQIAIQSDITASRLSDARAFFPMRKALREGTCRIVAMGDSKTEGTGLATVNDRWMHALRNDLRTKFSTADTGVGYVPAKYGAFYPIAGDPVTTGTVFFITNTSGLGNRALQLELGATVTFPQMLFNATQLKVHWQRNFGMGTMQVVTGSTVHAEFNTEGAGPQPMVTEVTIPTGNQQVIIRPKAATAPVRIEGIFHSTSASGVKVIDGSLSGGQLRDFSDFGKDHAGEPLSYQWHWEVVTGYDPHGIIMAFGANDMSVRGPAEWASNAQSAVENAKEAAPNAGIVLLHGSELTDRAGTGQVREYEAALRAAFADDPRVSIMYESSLWLPTAGYDYTWGGPEGWLTDTVHTSAVAHGEIARYIGQKLI